MTDQIERNEKTLERIIAVLAQRLGGKVEISYEEISRPEASSDYTAIRLDGSVNIETFGDYSRTLSTKVRASSEGVMRWWTRKCSMREQAVLVAAVRGCDGLSKNDPSKSVVRAYRYDLLNPSCEKTEEDPTKFATFMGYVPSLEADRKAFLEDLDGYPFHFLQHLAQAAHVMAVRNPLSERKRFWREVFLGITTEGFHARPESDTDMIHRLRDR